MQVFVYHTLITACYWSTVIRKKTCDQNISIQPLPNLSFTAIGEVVLNCEMVLLKRLDIILPGAGLEIKHVKARHIVGAVSSH